LSAVVFGALLAAPAGLDGQVEPEIRILTVVDYVAANEVYLASGTDHGIREGDTLSVYDGEGEGADLLGILLIQSATERRAVAVFPGTPFSVQRSDLLYLGLPRALAEARALEAEVEVAAANPVDSTGAERAEREPRPDQSSAPRPPVQWRGRVSLDMDALQTTTRFGEGPEDEIQRSFSTPTFRLQARARDLPGGVRLNTSMRLSHRTSPDDAIQPVTSLRFYQFDLEKRFEAVPVQVHMGRFHNPYEDFSGYWDGMMVHYGEEGLGAGVAVGFKPELWNEGLSTERPQVSGFVDYSARGATSEYSGAVSYHTTRPSIDEPDRTYLGLSQRIRLGGAWIRQRLQVDRSIDGADWALTRLQLDASVPLPGGLSAHAGWRRWRTYYAVVPFGELGPRRDRASAGLSFWSPGGGISADVSLDRPDVGDEARTVSSSFYLRRTPLLGLGFSGIASYWERGDDTSILLAPQLRRELGRAEVRAGYRFYRTSGGFGDIFSHFGDLAVTMPLGGGLSARIHGLVQWGDDLTSNRILASLWKSF
jgi:hypothetical protein